MTSSETAQRNLYGQTLAEIRDAVLLAEFEGLSREEHLCDLIGQAQELIAGDATTGQHAPDMRERTQQLLNRVRYLLHNREDS